MIKEMVYHCDENSRSFFAASIIYDNETYIIAFNCIKTKVKGIYHLSDIRNLRAVEAGRELTAKAQSDIKKALEDYKQSKLQRRARTI